MKQAGVFFQRLMFYGVTAFIVIRLVRGFRGGQIPMIAIVGVTIFVFLGLAMGLMQMMFSSADDGRSDESPAPGRKVYPAAEPAPKERDKKENETWESEPQEYSPQTFTLTLPAARLTVGALRSTPLAATDISLNDFCRAFNEASRSMSGDVRADVTVRGSVFSMGLSPSALPAMHTPWKDSPGESRPSYKKIAEEIGTEADLRELERREREELKRLK